MYCTTLYSIGHTLLKKQFREVEFELYIMYVGYYLYRHSFDKQSSIRKEEIAIEEGNMFPEGKGNMCQKG